MNLILVLLAGGESKRFKSSIPKPYCKIKNKTLLEYSLDSFNSIQEIKKTIIVYNKKHIQYIKKIKLKNTPKIPGGKTRQESSYKALKKIKGMNCKKVLIHDVARPNVSKNLIKKIILKLKKKDAVIPIIKIKDAVKNLNKNVTYQNLNRNKLCLAQTPQGFTFNKIYEKHKKNFNKFFDDDAALFINDKEKVFTVSGSKTNLKITDKEDLSIFKSLKKGKTYTGIGFDIHRLIKKRTLYLGGIKIPFERGLEGYSDADPVLHALIDSLLGACRLGDIGKLFSSKNKKYKNIRSTILLKKVIELIKSKNFSINNIDINIIIQKPKIKKYSKKMIQTISKLCEINNDQINIKGKTTEKLGLIGKGKAIASEVICSVIKYE